jgi:hypothetical protein
VPHCGGGCAGLLGNFVEKLWGRCPGTDGRG